MPKTCVAGNFDDEQSSIGFRRVLLSLVRLRLGRHVPYFAGKRTGRLTELPSCLWFTVLLDHIQQQTCAGIH